MKVLFVYSDISGQERYGARKYYSGIGSLSAVLKADGHETALLYLQQELPRQAFLAEVDAARPDLIAFSATTHQYPYIERYAEYLRAERPELLRVIGGTHATLVPEQVAASPAFDVICVGEGEYPLRDLCRKLEEGGDFSHIENLWVRRKEGMGQALEGTYLPSALDRFWVRNPLRPLIADLDELPFVDRDVFMYGSILKDNDGWVDIMAGRGCPYDCSYCCNPGLKRRYAGLGRYVRLRSVEHVLGELRALAERYPIKTINFQDDTFTLDKRWTLAFCQAYGASFDYPFWINSRVERLLDEDVVRALAEAGCAGVRIGIENGDEELRRRVLKRTMSNQEIIAAFALMRRYGLKVYTCNMIGVPGETPQTIEATIELNRRLAPEQFQFSVFYPYPMTELYDICVAQGLIRPGVELSDYYSRESVLNLPTLSEAELMRGYERFEALSAELALKRASPAKHRLYRVLLKLYGGDGPRLQRHLDALRRIRRHKRDTGHNSLIRE
ncbi:MAG: radical SAM protein [Chloroflexi bacterium]|nr:radical SAM protein [Chloroflexota bacterium]